MNRSLTAAESVRIASLLDRLDPQPAPCQVSGCSHLHLAPSLREDAPALAA